jgi:uncharacterized protein YbjT (DUF2867 family)
MKIKAIVTGATGMVGEGVLYECLQHSDVEKILVLGRRSCGTVHLKLQEIIQNDLNDLSAVSTQLIGYNACFFCAGISSVGMKKAEYHKVTYEMTLYVARMLAKQNPDMTFCYISGAGTDSTEKGKIMWARVKGETENELMKLPFKQVFALRPAFMRPAKGAKNVPAFYRLIGWCYPLGHALFPKYFLTLREVALAMIHCATSGYEKQILEVPDIAALANKGSNT